MKKSDILKFPLQNPKSKKKLQKKCKNLINLEKKVEEKIEKK
jgi:hypothetical protein